MEYLLSILNSPVSELILKSYLKIVSEKEYLVSILPIKKYIRVPIISNQKKETKKQKIIELTERMLDMEKQTVGDLVNIDTLTQRFACAEVKEEKLILSTKDSKLSFRIQKGTEAIVKNAIESLQKPQKPQLKKEEYSFTLFELKELPAYDEKQQMKIKKEIDKLIFDLYGFDKEERKIILNS